MSNLKCNIDGDILAYEVAVQGQFVNEEGETVILPYQNIRDYLEGKVDEILEAVGSTRAPTLFLTGTNNFRLALATVKEYKANRKKYVKPFHLANVRAQMISMYDTNVSPDDEADDELAMAQKEDTICCSRDKDLKQIEGYHYGWESGHQPEDMLHYVEGMGYINARFLDGISEKTGKPTRTFKKLTGEGYLFFLAQTLMGDVIDNIPGCKGIGGGKAYDNLIGITDKVEAIEVVERLYKETYDEETYLERLEEQAQLVWMVRSRNEEGKLQMWTVKDAKESTSYSM